MQHLRIVPTLTHGLLDQLIGIVLVVSPWIFEYHSARGAAVLVPVVLGAAVMINSLLTDHEMGLVTWIKVSDHLSLDMALGLILAASPWIFDFAERIIAPHVIGGLFITVLPLFTVRAPFDETMYTEVVIREGRSEVVRHARTADNSPY
jgi:hypothetical protein